jgi:hypothetical protein
MFLDKAEVVDLDKVQIEMPADLVPDDGAPGAAAGEDANSSDAEQKRMDDLFKDNK